MRFTYTVEVEVDRVEGKFASRDDLGTQLVDQLENANPDELIGENEGTYSVIDWSVTEEEQSK